jgi:very-short-patch-repair endonuclease
MGRAIRQARTTELERDVLVALLKDKRDLAYLQDDKWYRVPVDTAPKHWPPRWLALYQGKGYGEESYAVNYYGRVQEIQTVRRRDLFPDEFVNPKSDRKYYKVLLQSVEKLDSPIRSTRRRRLVFVPTTWHKFNTAKIINDLFADSPAEDRLWDEFKRLEIDAERQWEVTNGDVFYKLDFALFCKDGNIDVEVDGDQWHHNPQRAPQDNARNNELVSIGWQVLRFTAKQVRDSLREYCIREVRKTIKRLDGLSSDGLVSSKFYNLPGLDVEQRSLFEESAEYDID